MLNLTTREWEELNEDMFRKLFKQSPLSRSKYKGIQRNIQFLKADTKPETDPSQGVV